MKNFHDLLHFMQSTEERYHKDMEVGLKKQLTPILATSVSNMYNEIKQTFTHSSKFHQAILAQTYKDLAAQLDLLIKEIKTTKTKLLDTYTKLAKDVDVKKAAHAKAKKAYEDSVDKAESAVANFRSGRSQVGNDKQVKKLEEAMHAASKELEKNHATYMKAVNECQFTQLKFEEQAEQLLIQFEDLEKKSLATSQAIMHRFVDIQTQYKQELTNWVDGLNTVFQKVDPPADLLAFILDTYDGKPLEPHVVYEPKNSDVIPHYGDLQYSQDSQEHSNKTYANHQRLMINSTCQAIPSHANTLAGSGPAQQPAFLAQPTQSVFTPGNAGDNQPDQTQAAAAAAAPQQTQPTLQCIALYDFVGQEVGDLSFNTGQTIDVMQYDPAEDWWFGTINGVSGSFPKTYVSQPSAQPQQPAAAPATAAAAPGPLTDTTAAAATGETPIIKTVVALYDFDPENPDELKLVANATYCVFSQIEDWYEGAEYTNNVIGARGIFPQSFTRD